MSNLDLLAAQEENLRNHNVSGVNIYTSFIKIHPEVSEYFTKTTAV